MTENAIPGPMTMIKVDGAKIKHLREDQGLTQLYLATAVHVTTDTISRWENKRYPSIKKENGLKLAEALNVQLEDIMEEGLAADPAFMQAPAVAETIPTPAGTKSKSKTWPFIALSAIFLCILAIVAWYSLNSSSELTITAERNAPEHCIAGQPFPVLIRVSGAPEDKSTSVIIRENLPANATVVKISPEIAGSGMKKDMIKWLKKINSTATFAYVIRVTGGLDDKIGYYGTAAISGDSSQAPAIGGSNSTNIGHYHWADVDKNNIISDSEILAVHDRYNEIEGIDVDLDSIEEIWLGSGYRWNDTTQALEILE